VRHIVLGEADDIGSEDVDDLIAAALAAAVRPIDPKANRQRIIKSVSVIAALTAPGQQSVGPMTNPVVSGISSADS